MAKSSVIQTAILRDANQRAVGVSFTGNGRTIVVRDADLNDVVSRESKWHGVKQKGGDAAALGAGATAADKMAAIQKVVDQITGADGVWTSRGEGDNQLLIRAIARHMGTDDLDKAREAYDDLTPPVKAALAKDETMVKIMGAIRAEDAKRRSAAAPETAKLATDALAKLKAMTGPTAAAKKAA